MIFDSHAHYDDRAFDEDRDELLSSLPEKGIAGVVNAGASIRSIWKTLELAEKYPHVYAAVGIHPEHAGELREEDMEWLRGMLAGARVVAVGEIGLDYYWDKEHHSLQKKWFEAQAQLAREEKLPIIVHSREAAADTLDMVKGFRGGEIGGVIHCFSYTKEMAREYLNMGFYLGIGGVVTFKNARKLKEVVEYAPLSSLLLETDCPYLAPVPNRGKRNNSIYLKYVAQTIAEIKQISCEEVIEATRQNARKMFHIQ